MKPTWSWQREVTGSVPLLRDYCNKLDMNKIKKLELDITNTVMGLLGSIRHGFTHDSIRHHTSRSSCFYLTRHDRLRLFIKLEASRPLLRQVPIKSSLLDPRLCAILAKVM
ncbi:hypothetical protein F2Q68_00034727 [Brassica cretica]|uniref:Uncharacterized protein n=1 Tax=Brassica cretica TaxID=69181 RepID=A0A8S9H694_BRACR|nr:hypothetical protein F2Q68_00034727 [Brassica cretica]